MDDDDVDDRGGGTNTAGNIAEASAGVDGCDEAGEGGGARGRGGEAAAASDGDSNSSYSDEEEEDSSEDVSRCIYQAVLCVLRVFCVHINPSYPFHGCMHAQSQLLHACTYESSSKTTSSERGRWMTFGNCCPGSGMYWLYEGDTLGGWFAPPGAVQTSRYSWLPLQYLQSQ